MQKVNARKVTLIIILLLILVVVALLIGNFTTAYMGADISDDVTNEGEITASGDIIIFSSGNTLLLNATTDNFNSSSGNLTDTTNPSVRLISSSRTNEATATYYAGIRIYENSYTYSNDSNAEIILTVRDETGKILTSSDDTSLSYVTVTDKSGSEVSGFDITDKIGAFNIAIEHPISTTSSTAGTTHTWTFTITFVNYTYDQSVNENANLEMDVILQQDMINNSLASYIIRRVYTEDGAENLYYHDGTGSYANADQEAGDFSYRYSGGYYEIADAYKNKYADIESMITDLAFLGMQIDGKIYNLYTESGTYDMYLVVAEEYCTTVAECNPEEVANAVINDSEDTVVTEFNDFLEQGMMSGKYAYTWGFTFNDTLSIPYYDAYDPENSIYSFNYNYQYDIMRILAQSGYLNEIKNYVCFGSDADICPEENLYQIIGVFDDDKDGNYQVKLIKADATSSEMLGTNSRDYYGTYADSFEGTTSYYKGTMSESEIAIYRWNYDTNINENYGTNNWTTSELNIINLNTNYWNYLGSAWQKLIAPTAWHISGIPIESYNSSDTLLIKSIYDTEINNTEYTSHPSTYTDEIGLMYISDYGYAASPEFWEMPITSYSMETDNWMAIGLSEWTIAPFNYYNYDYYINYILYVGNVSYIHNVNGYAVRPVFYLNYDVELIGGSGTYTDPYRLAV